MLLSYLKLSLRLLARNPFFTFINVAGLSVGFAVFFILWQYSQSELKSDQFHKDHQRIVRFGLVWKWKKNNNWYEGIIGVINPEITKRVANDYTEIEDFTRIFDQGNFSFTTMPHGKDIAFSLIDKKGKRVFFQENKVAYTDPNVFDFFNLPLINGDPKNILSQANSVAISKHIAYKYFGSTSPIGNILYLNDSIPLTITGVFRDFPHNTHLEFQFAISTLGIQKGIEKADIATASSHSYFKLKEGISINAFEKTLNENKDKYWLEFLRKVSSTSTVGLLLHPLSAVVFSQYDYEYFKSKSKPILLVLSSVSFLILLMAWINYINLSLSFNSKRFKELMARKTVGAKWADFIKQFIIESSVINLISLLVALTIIQLVRHSIYTYLGFYLSSWTEAATSTTIILISAIISGILLSGFYPAIITFKRSPNSIVKTPLSKKEGNSLTYTMTTVQFSCGIVLVIWIFSVQRQMDFILDYDMGIDKSQVVVIDAPILSNNHPKLDYFLNGLQSKGYRHTTSNSVTGDDKLLQIMIREGSDNYIGAITNGGVDENFIPFYGIKLLTGRNFIKDNPADQNSVIVSKETLRQLNIENPEKAIGMKLEIETGNMGEHLWKKVDVIGVIEGYRERSLFVHEGSTEDIDYNKDKIFLTYKDYLIPNLSTKKISIRIDTKDLPNEVRGLKEKYEALFPGEIFNWFFLDDHINNHYQQEKSARNQIALFTFLAIGIACLGLLGMISNKVVEKTKEIGIRKVMGAELHQIAQILLNTTAKQIVMATIIGIPVAYYLTQQYLEKFSERITLQWWHFALPVVILVTIMLATVASVLWKAARSNPVEALKYE